MSIQALQERITARRKDAAVAPPSHPDVATWRASTETDVAAIHRAAAAADAVDHPTWITPAEDIADTYDLDHIDPARDTMLALDADGTVIAFGLAMLHPSREGKLTVQLGGAVDPAWRRRGIGTAMLAWLRARALEQLAEAAETLEPRDDGTEWTADIKAYAEEINTDQQRITEAAGFTPERWFTTMERDMAAPVAPASPKDDITIIEYTRDRDEDARLARNDAFRDHWGSLPTPPESWAKFVGGPFFRPDLSRLAVDAEGAIAGFCLASVNEDDWEALGATNSYIDLIGVVRSHRGRGVAPATISATLAAIAAAGLERAVLDVDTASPTGANTLYEGLGFHPTHREVALVAHI